MKFTPTHPLYKNKILNKSTLKISYSCLPNIKSILDSHNKKIANNVNNQVPTYDCKNLNDCPVKGSCLEKNVVYRADVTTEQDQVTKVYVGSTKRAFKARYKEHLASFKRKQTGTKLTKYVHELKSKGKGYTIK